jgi:hypothetical protein
VPIHAGVSKTVAPATVIDSVANEKRAIKQAGAVV